MIEILIVLLLLFLLGCCGSKRSGGGQRFVKNRPPIKRMTDIPKPPPRRS